MTGPWAEGDALTPSNLNSRGGGNFPDRTYHVKWAAGTGTTQITNAIANAAALGYPYCFVPKSMLPYDASLVTFNNAVHMLREGGPTDSDLIDVRAYGGRNDGVDGWAGEQAAYDAASAAAAATSGSKNVYYGSGVFIVSKPVSAFKVNIRGCSAYRGDDYGGSTYLGGSFSGGPRLILQDHTSTLPLVTSLANGVGNAITVTGGWYNLRDCRQADLHGLSAFSVGCFYKGTGTNIGTLVSSRGKLLNNDTVSNCFSLQNNTGTARFMLTTSTTGLVSISGGTINDNAVHWVEGTYDGSTVRLFVDGNLTASSAATGTIVQGMDEAVTVGLDFSIPESISLFGNPNGALDGIWLSDIARHTTSYSNPTTKPTNDAHTLFLLNHDLQLGQATRAQSKDGDLWLVFRGGDPTFASGGTRFSIDNVSFGGSGVLNAIHVVPHTYDPSLTRLDITNIRSGILAPVGNFYNARYRDLKLTGGTYGRYGFFLSSTAGLADMTSIWTQAFRYHAILPGLSIRYWFMQMDSATVIGMVLQNQATSGVAWEIHSLVGNTEPGVSTAYRGALAFGGIGLRMSGVNVHSCAFETGNNAPFLIADDVDGANFSLCNFIRSGSPSVIMTARGTFRRPVVFATCEQGRDDLGFLPWSDTTGTAVVGLLGTNFSSSTGSALNFDASRYDSWDLTLTSDVTQSSWTKISYGQPVSGAIKMDSTGSRLFVWPTNSKGTATLSYGSAAVNTFSGFYDGVNVILTSVRTGL